LKLSKRDIRILHAALLAAVEGDNDLWEDLDDSLLERATDLLDEMVTEADLEAEDEDDDDLEEEE